MKLDLHTLSKEKGYNATAKYDDGVIIVHKGSKININPGAGFNPSKIVKGILGNKDLVDETGVLLTDVEFKSLSAAATFVTGRIANGMIAWKTPDGKYVRYTLKGEQ